MLKAKDYRARARESLKGGIFGRKWLYALLVYFIYTVITSVASSTGFGAIAVLIFSGPLLVGLAGYFVSLANREEHAEENVGGLFSAFQKDLGGSVLTGILVSVFTFLWALLLIIPGIVKNYSYSMSYYIRLDHPEYTAKQAITESRKMMKGNKFRLFCLDFSFIGWFIVGILALGIGVFWVYPYMQTARAEFYKDLKGGNDIILEVNSPDGEENGENNSNQPIDEPWN